MMRFPAWCFRHFPALSGVVLPAFSGGSRRGASGVSGAFRRTPLASSGVVLPAFSGAFRRFPAVHGVVLPALSGVHFRRTLPAFSGMRFRCLLNGALRCSFVRMPGLPPPAHAPKTVLASVMMSVWMSLRLYNVRDDDGGTVVTSHNHPASARQSDLLGLLG